MNLDPQPTVAELYERYAPLVLRRARRFVGSADAEEVVHEVFVKVMQSLDDFRGTASHATWLYRVTTNHCLNRLRNDRTRRALLADHAEAVPGATVWHPDAETLRLLDEIWRQLDEQEAAIVVCHFIDGMTHDAIAEVLGVSAATVRNRLRAIAARARALEEVP